MTFKPLLAATVEDVEKIRYPILVSPKLDGIRVLVKDGKLVTRNLKPLRNKYVSSILSHYLYEGFDGEIVVGDGNSDFLFRNTSSGVMSEEGEPDFTFWVFDIFNTPETYVNRYNRLKMIFINNDLDKRVKILEHKVITSPEELINYETEMLKSNYEGVMIRSPDGLYKNGRSTFKEAILLKLKKFEQDEAIIVGFNERMHNANEATTNALGRTERSSHSENLVGRNDLGSVEVLFRGKQFPIGSGFHDDDRKFIWNNKEKFLGKTVTFKYMGYGNYDLPRHPVFIGIRDHSDMGE